MSRRQNKCKKMEEEKQVENQQEEMIEKESETNDAEHQSNDKEEDFKAKYEQLNNKYLLLYSDFENYRRQTSKARLELIQTAAEGTIKDLLPVIDDYERALDTLADNDDEVFVKMKEGLELIYNKLINILSHKGLKPMNAKGCKFDENIHEAIARVPASREEDKGMVIDETTKGYYLNDKVIRYAKVVVAM